MLNSVLNFWILAPFEAAYYIDVVFEALDGWNDTSLPSRVLSLAVFVVSANEH